MTGEQTRWKMRLFVLNGLYPGPDSIVTDLTCCLSAHDYKPAVALETAAVKTMCTACAGGGAPAAVLTHLTLSLGFTSPSTLKLQSCGNTEFGKGSLFSLIPMLL